MTRDAMRHRCEYVWSVVVYVMSHHARMIHTLCVCSHCPFTHLEHIVTNCSMPMRQAERGLRERTLRIPASGSWTRASFTKRTSWIRTSGAWTTKQRRNTTYVCWWACLRVSVGGQIFRNVVWSMQECVCMCARGWVECVRIFSVFRSSLSYNDVFVRACLVR